MNIVFNHNNAPAFEFKDGRYYYTFTAEDDLPSVEILSDCMGDTQLKKIQIERHPDMTYWVPPEVYEGNLSGIFKDLKELLFEMRDTNSDFWGKIQLNARVMLEEYHQGTLSAEFMRTASGMETRLRNELTGVETRYTQTADRIRQRLSDTEGNYSSLSQIVQGIQSKVSGRNGIESQIHQLSGLIDQRVTRNEVQSIINQSGDTIWLSVREKVQALTDESKMTGSEIISAINITTGGIYAYSGNNKLVLTPDTTYIQNGTIKSAMIESLSASKLTAGVIDASQIRVIHLDAMNITGNRANFLRAIFQAVNSNVSITGTELRLQNNDGSYVELNTIPEVRSVSRDQKEVVLGNGRVHFKDGRQVTNGYIGVDLHTNTNKLGIYLSRGTDFFQIAQGVSSTYSTGATYDTVRSGDGWYAIASRNGIDVTTLLRLNGATLDTMIHPGQQLLIREGTSYNASNLRYESYIRFGLNSSRTNHEIYMDKPVTMTASPKISSDRRLKEHIQESPINALKAIEPLQFKSYQLKANQEYYPLGVIAQEAGILMRYNGTDDTYTIDLMTGLMLALKGIQELNRKVEAIYGSRENERNHSFDYDGRSGLFNDDSAVER